jgi:hypothetical protein
MTRHFSISNLPQHVVFQILICLLLFQICDLCPLEERVIRTNVDVILLAVIE